MKTSELQKIAKRLTDERMTLGWTQLQVAKMTNKSRGQVINYETGRSEMTVRFLFEIAVIGFDIQYIITGERSSNLTKVQNKINNGGDA